MEARRQEEGLRARVRFASSLSLRPRRGRVSPARPERRLGASGSQRKRLSRESESGAGGSVCAPPENFPAPAAARSLRRLGARSDDAPRCQHPERIRASAHPWCLRPPPLRGRLSPEASVRRGSPARAAGCEGPVSPALSPGAFPAIARPQRRPRSPTVPALTAGPDVPPGGRGQCLCHGAAYSGVQRFLLGQPGFQRAPAVSRD